MRLIAIAALVALNGCQQNVVLQRFSPDGTFSVMMPANREPIPEPDGVNRAMGWVCEVNGYGMTLVVIDYEQIKDVGEDLAQQILMNHFLKNWAQRTADKWHGNVVADMPTSLNNRYPGRTYECTAKLNKQGKQIDGIVKGSYFAIRNRAIILEAIGPQDWIAQPYVWGFLNSLRLHN